MTDLNITDGAARQGWVVDEYARRIADLLEKGWKDWPPEKRAAAIDLLRGLTPEQAADLIAQSGVKNPTAPEALARVAADLQR